MIIDSNFEDKVLASLLKSRDFCVVAAQHLKPSYFENPVKHNIAKMGIDFYNKYQTKLSNIGFVESVKDLVSNKTISDKDAPLYATEYKRLQKIDVSDYKFILEKLIIFIKNRETKKLIEEAVKKHLPKNDFAAIEEAMRGIAAISTLQEIRPYDYFSTDAIAGRTERRERELLVKTVGISTGIKKMDDQFPKHGWTRRELYIILAPPKRGKTMALDFFANVAALQGFNVALFSCETSEEVISDRLDAMNANIEIKKLPAHVKEVHGKLAELGVEGKLFIFEYPTKRCTVQEIERQIRRLEVEQGITIDLLVVDYGDILKPAKHYQDKLQEQAGIFEDLRALATIFNIPVITASQVNRTGSDKEIISGKDVAGTWEKIMVADGIISLSASEADIKENRMTIHFAECRNMERKTFKIKTAYNFGRFYKEFLEEVEMKEAA